MGQNPTFISMMVMTTSFFFVEIIVGYMTNSMALVADSFHMLSDIISLFVGFFAMRVSSFWKYFFYLHEFQSYAGPIARADLDKKSGEIYVIPFRDKQLMPFPSQCLRCTNCTTCNIVCILDLSFSLLWQYIFIDIEKRLIKIPQEKIR